ncbi:hypothetical protein B4N84_28350 [Flavobacterium sp. IR1]|nr:hypothetical protein B4N84_28350 [Flavobacterium sp. IR1]
MTGIYSCYSQIKTVPKKTNNKNKMEYFNIDIYKDWEIDSEWSSSENKKFLKKGEERLRIRFYEDEIQLNKTSVINPYKKIFVYYKKNKLLRSYGMQFYQFSIGIRKIYDETGILVKEIDNDKPYIFSLPQLIEKIKKEHDVDLEDLTQGCSVHRRVDKNLKKPIYEVYLLSKEDPYSKKKYFLMDGVTGELIHTTSYPRRSDEIKTPFNQYLISLEKKEQEDNAFYKNYKGKDYTKKEWEAFEEEWYRDFEEKKEGRNFFWDNIFKKLNE